MRIRASQNGLDVRILKASFVTPRANSPLTAALGTVSRPTGLVVHLGVDAGVCLLAGLRAVRGDVATVVRPSVVGVKGV
jgi:hypothetical protein